MSDGWRIEDVISSIETLFSTNDSTRIKQIQDYLQAIQKSDDGYRLAQLLLSQESKNCKYFGALTYTVFINTHLGVATSLSTDQVNEFSTELIGHVLNLSYSPEADRNLFIIKKLLSNLSLLYILHHKSFPADPVEQLIRKFGLGINGSYNEIQLLLLLLFNSIIIEDLSKKDDPSQEIHAQIYTSIFPRLRNLLETVSSLGQSAGRGIVLQTLECINSWIIYISNAETNSSQRYTSPEVEPIVHYLMKYLDFSTIEAHDGEGIEILNKVFTVLTELIETVPRLISEIKPILNAILFDENQFGIIFIKSIILDQEKYSEYTVEVESFVNLMISFLNLNIIQISRNVTDDAIYRVLEIVLTISNHPGRPMEEEQVSELLLSFWEELINIYVDDSSVIQDLQKENYDHFLVRRNSLLTRISETYWHKSHFYSGATSEFVHYRLQIADLFNLLYSLLSTSLYSTLSQNIVSTLQSSIKSIPDLEASLYLLYKVTDDLTFYDDDSTNAIVPLIDQIFSQKLIEVVDTTDPATPAQIQSTLLNFLSSIPFFFKTSVGSQYLTSSFNFLFSIILKPYGSSTKNVSLIASKTVLKICQDSKENLVGFLPNIEAILSPMLTAKEVDNLIRERLVNSYISIAQSMKDPEKFGQIVLNLLSEINRASLTIMENPNYSGPDHDAIEDHLISLLTCIHEIGKASQLPEDLEVYLSGDQTSSINSYWQDDPLKIKPLIPTILNQYGLSFSPLLHNTLVTEKCCNILKSGLNEPIEGPFKFELSLILDFLIVKINNCNQPSIPYIYKLMETVVITNGKNISEATLEQLISKVFIEKLPLFADDIDLMKSAMEFFSTVLERYPRILIHSQVFQSQILRFALSTLKFHETFLIKAVSKFWINLLNLKRGTSNDHERLHALVNELRVENNEFLGFTLTENVLSAFLENPRSNLDHFYPVFRSLISKFPLLFKSSLVEVMGKLVAANQKLSTQSAEQLVSKLMLTRGQRQANEILKRFWLEFNGLIDYN